MIELYAYNTPNGRKIPVALEEMGLPYNVHVVDITKDQQLKPDFLRISPNNKIPAIVDTEGSGGAPLSVFESGAILLYLAHKAARFGGATPRAHVEVIQWLMWQMGGLGPMLGQNHHFNRYAPDKIDYAINRYVTETNRLYGVLDRRLAERAFIAGEYTIADMACYPWIVPHEIQGQTLSDFPNLQRWFEAIRTRPATIAAYAKGKEVSDGATPMTDEQRRVLFGQTSTPGTPA